MNGPTEEESRVLRNIDDLAAHVRGTMMQCEKIRSTLKLGPATLTMEQSQANDPDKEIVWHCVLADAMDLHVARPLAASSFNSTGEGERSRSRYCYAKLVAPDQNVHEMFHTYFWTPDGRSLPLNQVLGYRNFQVVPFVEVEDVFVSKAVRSMQLKLRECIVYPPNEQPNMRFSVCFPDRVCSRNAQALALMQDAIACCYFGRKPSSSSR